eukprot:TRINITY_DN5075_c0_g1_i1.p1 TRINITY_DN5075_c0_g1~~TRINITY_DN5075_c0_g1_i1.p1  ORF type:complete len:213 (-),score=39.90 TRINITY_DN5075_c0_g1_i1:454-1092(-)
MNQLRKTSYNLERFTLLLKIARFYSDQGKDQEARMKLNSLRSFKKAKKYFREAMKLIPKSIQARLGFIRCMVNLCEFSDAFEFLKQNQDLSDVSEFWVLGSIILRKMNRCDEARHWVTEALGNGCHKEADRQKQILKNLEGRARLLEGYKGIDRVVHQSFYERGKHRDEPYRILSIDGGVFMEFTGSVWFVEQNLFLESRAPKSPFRSPAWP